MQRRKFKVITGPMFSSKTTLLLADIERAELQNKKVLVFKPRMDIRYSETGEIVTHSGFKTDAVLVSTGEDILNFINSLEDVPNLIAVDELFMIDNSADILVELFFSGIDIIVSSIELSYNLRPFEQVQRILPFATEVVKCTAVCTVCGDDAAYTHKKTSSGELIEVGGKDIYEPRCLRHHGKVIV